MTEYKLVETKKEKGITKKLYRFKDAGNLRIFIGTIQTETACTVRGFMRSGENGRMQTLHKEIFTGADKKEKANRCFCELARFYA